MQETKTEVLETGAIRMSDATSPVKNVNYVSYGFGSAKNVAGEVVTEALACISVNGKELATFMCSPTNLQELAVGFLFNEQIISKATDIRSIHVSRARTCVDIWLHDANFVQPERTIVTAGCGGGVTFDDLSKEHDPLVTDVTATPRQLAGLMKGLHLGASIYQRSRGIHSAVLADPDSLLLQVEDIGRHNCLDKLAGAALLNGIPTRDRLILSSGRISSEMINKARRLGVPIVCSRTSPTSLSVQLAESWNMTIVAYLRGDKMRVYTHPGRVIEA